VDLNRGQWEENGVRRRKSPEAPCAPIGKKARPLIGKKARALIGKKGRALIGKKGRPLIGKKARALIGKKACALALDGTGDRR